MTVPGLARTGGSPGRVTRVSGPLVDLVGLDGVMVFEIVEVGEQRLLGEVVAIEGAHVTAQLFEYTGGLAPGAPARALGEPLSARLGPGLLGNVFDGILRPLSAAPVWLGPGARTAPPPAFTFQPLARVGDDVRPGTRIGTAVGASGIEESVVAAPGAAGRLTWVADAGSAGPDDVIARVGTTPVRLTSRWPVRRPRPSAGRRNATVPLTTGQRVLDLLFPVAKGSTAAVVGGFGTGKTLLLQQVAKWCDADVIVYVGCGERGNEMADAIDELQRARGSPHGPAPARTHGDHRQHVEHAGDGSGSQHLHGDDRGRALPRPRARRRAHRRLDVALGRGAARVLVAQWRATGRGGLPGRPGRRARRVLRAGRFLRHARRRARGR